MRARPLISLIAVGWSLLGPGSGTADSPSVDDRAACIARRADFTGVAPLTYANAIGESGSRIYVQRQPSEECARASSESCGKGSYILPGDAVAIGKTCGDWDFVQYLGEAHPTLGWVLSKQLAPRAIPPPTPPEVVPPLSWQPPDIPPSEARRYAFHLTRGHGKAVCEAYLQRLNQTEFYNEPYCGRPESARVPGFRVLHRRWLSLTQYLSLEPYANAVLSNRDISEEIPPAPTPTDFRPAGWTYDPPIDIDNDGPPDNLVMWSGEERGFTFCGSGGARGRGDISAVLLTPTGKVDAARTRAIFGRPGLPGVPYDRELGHEFGVFVYRDLTYFDVFGDADLGIPNDQLAVYLYRNGRREEVCNYKAKLGER